MNESTMPLEVYGHRGAMGYKPENTLSSIREALKQKVDMIEVDVYAVPTGEVIVIHDDEVDRTTNGHGAVMDMSFKEIRRLNAGNGERIPTLEEVIDEINRLVTLNIELKGPNTAVPTAKIIKRYISEQKFAITDFLVSSFEHDELHVFHDLVPEIEISVLYDEIPPDFVQLAKNLGASVLGMRATNITSEIVATARQSSLAVTAWTVNEPKEAQHLATLGVKGVFTNYPDVIRAAIN